MRETDFPLHRVIDQSGAGRLRDSRTVRIFISSTFRDFAQERDLLVRKIFPELRRRSRERQVELVDVDLRWGITEEEAQQGKVLPICLAEIDRARPFFMGLIGERYGWVPSAKQFDRSLLIEQPWLEEHAGGKSVTELEILHGVLNNPQMVGRAFFYFRDPVWSAKHGQDYASEEAVEKRKLVDLKERIRTSGFPILENYPDPESLAERVRQDLWRLIDESYPESDVPDALTLERRRHDAYGSSRRRLYLGGEPYFKVLDEVLEADSPQPVLVSGQSGGGKSALLSNWLARWQSVSPEVAVIVHHLGCGVDAADPVRLAVRLMQEIAALTGEKFEPKSEPDEQLDELPEWLATANAWAGRTNRSLLIVLDGLDKLADRRHLRWLPTMLPPGVRLVASCLTGEVLESARTRLDWWELVVEPFTVAEQSRFMEEYLGRYRKQLTAQQAAALQNHPISSNPLFLLTVLEELRIFGVHEELDRRLVTLLSPPPSKQLDEEPTVDDAFEHVLARVEDDLGREPVQRVMEAIWASRAGLYTDELLAIADVPLATWAGISNILDESLYESVGRINFGHDYLRKAVEDRYGIEGNTRLQLHRRLADYFATREPDARVAEELPWQWQRAGDPSSLRACLLDSELFPWLVHREHAELLEYWRSLLVQDVSAEYERVWTTWAERATTDHLLVGDFLYFAGYYDDFVESIYRAWLNEFANKVGDTHPATLHCANELAGLLLNRGKAAEGAEVAHAALWRATDALGPDDDLTLNLLGNLACCLGFAQHADAEDACRKWVAALARAGRTESGTYGLALYNLGETLRRAHQTTDELSILVEADGCFQSAHSLQAHFLGPLHVDTLRSRAAYGVLQCFIGRIDMAEEVLREAYDGLVISLGESHPETLRVLGNLATISQAKGDDVKAESMFRTVLTGLEARLGSAHEDTLISYANLGRSLVGQGRYPEARQWLLKAMNGIRESHSDDHLLFEQILEDLASAEPLKRRAMVGYEKALEETEDNQDEGEDAQDDDDPPPSAGPFADPPGTITNTIGMKLVPIPAGEFLMGSPDDCPLGEPEEEFQHRVRITKPFLIGMHPVTQTQYEQVTRKNPSNFKGPDLPVEHLTWKAAKRFCQLLSSLPGEREAGRRYRLPTEAEWEYACRAGTTTPFNTGDSLEPHQARFAATNRSSQKRTSPVGTYPPNTWGLFDMHGNVWEWCDDWFSADYFYESLIDDPPGPAKGTHHTLRGGSASLEAHECRTTIRGEAPADDGPFDDASNRYAFYGDFGVRVVCEIRDSSRTRKQKKQISQTSSTAVR